MISCLVYKISISVSQKPKRTRSRYWVYCQRGGKTPENIHIIWFSVAVVFEHENTMSQALKKYDIFSLFWYFTDKLIYQIIDTEINPQLQI